MRYDDVLAILGAFAPMLMLLAYAIGEKQGRREQLADDCRVVKRTLERRVEELRQRPTAASGDSEGGGRG